MKNLQINESSIGALEYNLVELVGSDINIYQKLPPGLISVEESTAADYCLYDKTNDKLIIVKGDTDLSNYPSDNYTPIGVVVVPGSHNVYGDGSCGVMSLKTMSCTNPQSGSANNSDSSNNRIWMCWGVRGSDISALPNLNQAPIVGIGSNVGNASSTVTGEDHSSYLPSDKFSNIQCPHDTDAYYFHYGSSSLYKQSPSSYLTDGSRNPAYYQTSSPSSSSNALADFDGIGNTEKIIAQRGTKDYNSWTPTYDSQTDYSAASCCDMFHTEGTQQGDWYLPACGELGYIMPPLNKINDAIVKIRTAYGSSVGVELNTNSFYQSSTEYDSDYYRIVRTLDGGVDRLRKYNNQYVRAFLRVSPDGKPVNS